LKSDQPPAAPVPPADAPRAPLISRRLAAGLAIAAVLAGGGGLWAAAQPRGYQTDVGEMRRVNLRDGSIVELNTDTSIKIAYSGARRDIWLQSGEGNFIVAKDKLRPFVVHVGEATFTAVGTAFAIRADGKGPVTLTVTEGVVSLKPDTPAKPLFVAALQRASIDAKAPPKVESVSHTEVSRELAWTDGRIALTGETLGEAAAEFNRYNERKLVVASAAAAARVGGVFRTSEVETFARTAAASLGLEVQEQPGGDIVLGAGDTLR
ncbi:MAG TPA: FecR domain-containing protein, partial [Caulobacteraceae bacterium]|nr:FecR domain-containing protein [Caulobacteraceae bacterium]